MGARPLVVDVVPLQQAFGPATAGGRRRQRQREKAKQQRQSQHHSSSDAELRSASATTTDTVDPRGPGASAAAGSFALQEETAHASEVVAVRSGAVHDVTEPVVSDVVLNTPCEDSDGSSAKG